MNLSANGLEFIKSHEGLRLEAYRDVAGIWTIGYGHTNTAKEGQTITESEAENLLRQDVVTAKNAVNRYVVEKGVPVNQNQFDALVSLVFNLGSHNIFTKNYSNGYPFGSRLYNLLLQFDFEAASQRFTDFIKAGGRTWDGLVKRRKEERDLFLSKKKMTT